MKSASPLPFFLPDTKLFSKSALKDMISKYKHIYIKPFNSWGGKNVSTLEKQLQGEYIWTVQGKPSKIFITKEAACKEIESKSDEQSFIVQQAAPILAYESRPFDIRSHIQRNLDGNWIYEGDLVRVGGDNAIVSNVAISSGSVQETNKILSALFPPEVHNLLSDSLVRSSYRICEILDQYYPFIEVGVDFGVDSNGRLWVIEVNTDDALGSPERELFLQLPDKSIYEKIMKRSEENIEQYLRFMFVSYLNYLDGNSEQQ
ncbi:YheC/YheD family protein [Peribacillus sp. SCS-155]|uniref:YheC/YheD family protein n=1 Tax=Peribacillus sedimenti TaxID=3115297 RepID=UPI003905DA7C